MPDFQTLVFKLFLQWFKKLRCQISNGFPIPICIMQPLKRWSKSIYVDIESSLIYTKWKTKCIRVFVVEPLLIKNIALHVYVLSKGQLNGMIHERLEKYMSFKLPM